MRGIFIFQAKPSYGIVMLEFLPPRIKAVLRHVNLNKLYELRLRADKPLRANLNGAFCWLGENGVTLHSSHALVPTEKEIEDTLFAAGGYSLYAVENQIRQGFLTGKCGERIGIAGSFVYEKGEVLSVRNVTSLCIRIPHAILGCAEELYAHCLADRLRSVILLSPPGVGKTTLLRDLTRLVSERRSPNILVIDERGELSAGDLGGTSDVMKFADKLTAFTAGIRALRPELIVTDELLPSDYEAIRRATASGICVLASAHLVDCNAVPDKLFERRVLLTGVGKIVEIKDEEGNHVA